MPAKHLTLAKVEIAEIALRELLECADLDPAYQAGLTSALGQVISLRPNSADPAAHTPVVWEPGIYGCTCGFRPNERPSRASMMMSPYHSHLAKIGLPRTNAPIVYGYGPKAGQPTEY